MAVQFFGWNPVSGLGRYVTGCVVWGAGTKYDNDLYDLRAAAGKN